MSDEAKASPELMKLLRSAAESTDNEWLARKVAEWAVNLIESQAKRIEELLKKVTASVECQLAYEEDCKALEGLLSGRTLLRNQSCGCVVCACDDDERCHGCGGKMCGRPDCVFMEPGHPRAEYKAPNPYIESLQAANAELKEEIATLRATAELAWLSLRDYTMAQSRMSDGWGRASESAKRYLWKDLHFCEAGGREAMNAIKANAVHPTNSPTDSDGSGT